MNLKKHQTISKGQKGKHRIQGISAGFEPSIIDRDVIDGFELVTSDDAIETAKNLAAKEGSLLVFLLELLSLPLYVWQNA